MGPSVLRHPTEGSKSFTILRRTTDAATNLPECHAWPLLSGGLADRMKLPTGRTELTRHCDICVLTTAMVPLAPLPKQSAGCDGPLTLPRECRQHHGSLTPQWKINVHLGQSKRWRGGHRRTIKPNVVSTQVYSETGPAHHFCFPVRAIFTCICTCVCTCLSKCLQWHHAKYPALMQAMGSTKLSKHFCRHNMAIAMRLASNCHTEAIPGTATTCHKNWAADRKILRSALSL